MYSNINRLTTVIAQPIIVFIAFWRWAVLSLPYQGVLVADRDKTSDNTKPTRAEIDAELAAAFETFGRKFLATDRPLTPQQIEIINTPIGFSPNPK